MSDSTIVRAAIHPGIGIARVGNSPDDYVFAPETPRPKLDYALDPHDAQGALKRQVARFRIYGLNAAGDTVRELTEADGAIQWSVHVANRKAAWYNIEAPLDIPDGVATKRRNIGVIGADRRHLVIDAGRQTIDSLSPCPVPLHGQYFGSDVYLGELRLDDEGRLLFFGGRGKATPPRPGATAVTYANNEGWHDDVCDGPVHASVTLKDGTHLQVESAWVVVAPPNYGAVTPIVTMYDVMHSTLIVKRLAQVTQPSFTQSIYPILDRFCQAQWVNEGFWAQFGWQGPNDFRQRMHDLANPKTHPALRRQIFNQFRYPQNHGAYVQLSAQSPRQFGDPRSIVEWPWIYGDSGTFVNPSSNGFLSITPLMYQYLSQWAAGNFIADWQGPPPRYDLDDLPVDQRPAALDQAALEHCLGGPFHPGSELPWVLRHATIYRMPFRIHERSPNLPEPDFGDTLKPEEVYDASAQTPVHGGPLFGQGPGDLTRWMALPWHTDAASCRSGYESQYDPHLPTFWPARVPNQVLSEKDYQIVMDTSRTLEERQQAFGRRRIWYRFLGPGQDYWGQINHMVQIYGEMGVLQPRRGPTDVEGFPDLFFVEILPKALEGQTGTLQDVATSQGLIVTHLAKLAPRSGPKG